MKTNINDLFSFGGNSFGAFMSHIPTTGFMLLLDEMKSRSRQTLNSDHPVSSNHSVDNDRPVHNDRPLHTDVDIDG